MVRISNYKVLSLIALFVFSSSCFSQSIKIRGTVTDSIQNILSYANIIVEPTEGDEIQFTASDEKGRYQLRLKKNRQFKIRVSYLGFRTKKIQVNAIKDTVLNFILYENSEVLNEIKIDTKLAVSVKEDTITYKTDQFITGEERKLRDVLKKLPGIEVDRSGNVSVQGKKVTKVLVENKQFFTGDSKLAVNNIPADVVTEIEILDNYNDISILKGLENSEEIALNVKLKEGRKKFWFGDLEAGVGIKDRHLLHPSLFYYSPKTSVNIIGDINNTGQKSFTFRDYLNFEGGYNKIVRDPKAYFSRLNDDFSKFLNNQNFKASDYSFGGFNINQYINENTDLIGYTIFSKSISELESQYINEYVSETGSLFENRTVNNNPINQFIIGKIGIENTQDDGGKFKISSFLKVSDNTSTISTSTNLNSSINIINTYSRADNFDFKQNIEWYKGVSENHTISSLVSFNYLKGESAVNWRTNDIVFQDLIPVTNEELFNIFKNKETTSQNFSLLLKHYWVLGDFIHLYTTGGLENYRDTYNTNEFQELSDGTINNFITGNFGNNIDFDFDNFYIGSHVKFQKGKFTFRPGLFFHDYKRKIDQLNQKQELNKKYLLPELLVKIDLTLSEKINIRYNKKVRFPSIIQLLENFTLTNFNSVFRGNSFLENELYHQASIYYYKFSLLKKLNYNISFNYRKNEQGVKNNSVLEGINYITQPILLNNSDENIFISANLNKIYGDYKFSFGVNTSFSNYLQITNNDTQKNTSESQAFNTGVKTTFSEFPNIGFSYKKTLNIYRTELSTSKFENDNVTLDINHTLWEDFNFNLEYNYRRFNNKSINNKNQNDILNTSISYQKEKSPWYFEASANNLFNNQFIRNSTFSNFLISDSKTFVLPRILLFKVSYKL